MAKILKSAPSRPAKFPPPHGGEGHKVSTGDSFVSLAGRYGRSDPWDIIEFNFRTRDPREVNWYLEYYVGCTKPSPDGNNYRFDSSDDPGIIYIPPRTWTPSEDLALRRLVVGTLASPAINRLNVIHGGYQITGHSMAVVANKVIDGEIAVVYDSSVGAGEAEYDSGTDAFHLGFRSAHTPTRKALVVHEAVHAALDLKVAGVTIAESESLAYVVQSFYVREHTVDPEAERLTSENTLKDRVYELAWDMAGTLSKGRQPTSVEWLALDHAVRRHPTYKRTAGNNAGFDGV
ncbi:MAG: hypothetical protein MUE50_13035 [Pirellulaceae bacterium]|jgi:hypothetical protein|nr:hypothetical protein [Pirellulaceae bacterium]